MFEFKIFPIIDAQELDSAAQPTFGPIDIGNSTGSQSSILVRSNTTAPIVGNRFKATVEVKTNTVLVTEVYIVVEFDQARLSVIDQDTNNTGIQIKLLSSVFEVTDIETDNSVAAGKVKLYATAKSNTPVAVNGDFAEIEFQAQTAGSTQIRVGTGVDGSYLSRESGTKLNYQSNTVTLNVTTASTSTSTTTTSGTSGSTSTSTTTGSSSTSTSTTGTTGTTTIPNTAVDSPAGIIVVFTGILLIITGIKLRFDSTQERAKKQIGQD
jgi:hypothetical protein